MAKGNKVVTDVETKATGESKLNESPEGAVYTIELFTVL